MKTGSFSLSIQKYSFLQIENLKILGKNLYFIENTQKVVEISPSSAVSLRNARGDLPKEDLQKWEK